MKKMKVICDHRLVCKSKCRHGEPHYKEENACNSNKCDFLCDMGNTSHVECNLKAFRKEKLNNLKNLNEV